MSEFYLMISNIYIKIYKKIDIFMLGVTFLHHFAKIIIVFYTSMNG